VSIILIEQQRRVLSTWKEIAAYLGLGVRTVQRYEERFAFPIRRPYSRNRTCVIALVDEIDLWLQTTGKAISVGLKTAVPSQPKTLNSWKEIAEYVNKGVRTVQRYHCDLGLPVHNGGGSFRRSVLAFTQEIDAWLLCTSKGRPAPPEPAQQKFCA
jgi:hypothetical protein